MLGYQSGFSPSEFLKNSPIKSLYGIMVQTRNRTEERNSNCLASEQEKLCTWHSPRNEFSYWTYI